MQTYGGKITGFYKVKMTFNLIIMISCFKKKMFWFTKCIKLQTNMELYECRQAKNANY